MPEADVTVALVGSLDVLSVGKGDLKLTWGDGDEADAREVIEEMLRKGYSIFVETDVGPASVQRFSAERMEYVISEVIPGNALPAGPPEPPALGPGESVGTEPPAPPGKAGKPTKTPAKRTRERKVPVAGSKATAVGRTAGG
jgi:hypothetical protein